MATLSDCTYAPRLKACILRVRKAGIPETPPEQSITTNASSERESNN
jgi:hypothetical protein